MTVREFLDICEEQNYMIVGKERFYTKEDMLEFKHLNIKRLSVVVDYEDDYNPTENIFVYVLLYLQGI